MIAAVLAWTAMVAPAQAAEDYKLQGEDVVTIRVSGEDKLSQNYTLDEQGFIVMEMVGKVRLAGLTVKGAQELLTKELGKYLKLFEVSVFPVGAVGNRVLVFGQVNKQGSVKIRDGNKLLDVIAEAGGTTPLADERRVNIARKSGGKSETLNLVQLRKDPTLDLPIYAGDTVTVPSKEDNSVRVEGEVKTSGAKSLDEYRTAYAAIMSAGPTEKTDWTRIALRKKNSNIPLMIDLSKVREGLLKDDIELQEGDVLNVLSKLTGNVYVRGEVKMPGEKELLGKTQLWDFIRTNGGDFSERADRRRVQVTRKGKAEPITFDLTLVANGGRRSDDPEMELAPGDVIFVPTAVASLRGEVKTAGPEKPIGVATNVWDFIMSQGGGFTERADKSHVKIYRPGVAPREINLLEVENGKRSYDDTSLNIQPGDVVEVPNDEKIRFVIVGGVKKPGPFPAYEGMTLLDALGKAEGFSERAKRDKLVIAPATAFDKDGRLLSLSQNQEKNGKKKSSKKDEEIPDGLLVIDIKRMLAGDASQNVAIKPGDRIFIPELPPVDQQRRKPSFVQSLMGMLPLAGMLMGGGMGGFGMGGFGGGFGGYGGGFGQPYY